MSTMSVQMTESANARAARVPGPVVKLGWISFFTDVASAMVYPIVPLFVVGVLKAPALELGAIDGTAAAVVCLMMAWSG